MRQRLLDEPELIGSTIYNEDGTIIWRGGGAPPEAVPLTYRGEENEKKTSLVANTTADKEFKSMDAAAMNFGECYNQESISNNVEILTYIYLYKMDGKTYYSYTATEGSKSGGAISISRDPQSTKMKNGQTYVAFAHTHGAYTDTKASEQFGTTDIREAGLVKETKAAYVVTPGGKLKKVTGAPLYPQAKAISWSMPKDKNFKDYRLRKMANGQYYKDYNFPIMEPEQHIVP